MKSICFLLLIVSTCLISHAALPDQKILAKQLDAVMKAPYDGKPETIKKHTHPTVMELMGGDEGFKQIFHYIEKTLKQGGVSFISAFPGTPYGYMKSENNEFFCVKVTLTLKKGEENLVSDVIQVAVLPQGADTWTYIDGSNITIDKLREIFPDLPEKFSLAEPEKVSPQPEVAPAAPTSSPDPDSGFSLILSPKSEPIPNSFGKQRPHSLRRSPSKK